jgi:putative membrane protein
VGVRLAAKKLGKLLVLCVDRDNDLGKKTRIEGPVVGREKNLDAANALALADPSEADANCMFAAVKKFDELTAEKVDAEIATITGWGKTGFKSDRILNEQLDSVLQRFPADGFVLVTDGAEDDQIIPILQSRAKIVSKETVVVRQAQEIESAYFTIKEVLKDPFVSRIVFGIPGIILLLYVALGSFSFQIIAFVFGFYLLLKGFGVEERILQAFNSITESISVQRTSFPFYVGSLFIIAFGAITAYNKYIVTTITDPIIDTVSIAHPTYLFISLAALSVVIGRSIDLIHFKKAYLLKKYFLSGVSVILLWFILDAGTLVLLRQADLNWFLASIIFSFIVLLIAFRLSEVMDVGKKITSLFIGLPIYSKEGIMLGKVDAIDRRKNVVLYTDAKTNRKIELHRSDFFLRAGRGIVCS